LRNQVAYTNHDVRLHPVGPEDALLYLRRAAALFVKRGAVVAELPAGGAGLTDGGLLAAFLGRSGALRAPTLLTGVGLIAGWDETVYRHLLGLS